MDPRYKRMRALLIESVRVDGKPRQRHLAFLGSVTYQDRNDVEERWQFWRNADQALYRLGNRLSPIQRGEVEKALAERSARSRPPKSRRARNESRRVSWNAKKQCENV